MVTVIATVLVLLMFVLAATSFATGNVSNSRRAQDYAAAMAAAQTGVDDVLSRLNTCDSYWNPAYTACAGLPPTEPARNGWAPVPGSADAANPAEYHYSFVSTPATTPGLLRIRASGRVNGVTRTITVDLRKESFLKYIYYTDFESMDPIIYNEINSRTDGSKCARYYYVVSGNASARDTGCDVYFSGGDDIKGPLYSNDALGLMYRNNRNPKFHGETWTNWQKNYKPAPSGDNYYRGHPQYPGQPDSTGQRPKPVEVPVEMPPNNLSILNDATAGGCVYRGPTEIVFKVVSGAGKMDVTSPATTSAASGCGPGTNLDLPANGVIYVDSTTSCPASGPHKTYQPSGSVTSYDCRHGNAFMKGTLRGQVTVATRNDIVVVDHLKYNTPSWTGSAINVNSPDVLGLVAQGFVKMWHPVRSNNQDMGLARTNLEIHAAILSVDHSFTLEKYLVGNNLGTLKVVGGIYQRHRGPVGSMTAQGTTIGYLKDYIYDSRLMQLPPPSFLSPASSAWTVTGLSE